MDHDAHHCLRALPSLRRRLIAGAAAIMVAPAFVRGALAQETRRLTSPARLLDGGKVEGVRLSLVR